MNAQLDIISKTVFDNQLYILPLYSVREDGICSCGKADCSSPGKHPLFRYNWKVIASNNKERVEGWFSSYSKMNFGLATGRLSKITGKYLVVIDVDAASHPILSSLPPTFSYRTGSGGHHLWFWSKYPVKNSVSLLADKVDVRGTDGYVVVPPSKHQKGAYQHICNLPIADLPGDILDLLLSSGQPEPSLKKKRLSNPITSSNRWVKDPVPDLRERMKTTVVPEGVRNVVMHRLLSSDRAKGALKSVLETNAQAYLKRFANSQTFRADIPVIIDSVMKYPAYNNSHEKVNEVYVSWLKKKHKKLVPATIQSDLETTEQAFFASLKPSEPKVHRCSLQQVADARKAYMQSKGLVYISSYKSQLLAKKLTDLGFKRHRTSKGNVWNILLPNAADLL